MPISLGPHATGLDRNQVLCSCPELGCDQNTIQYRGKVHQGKIFSRQTYPKHLQQIPPVPPEASGTVANPAPALVQLSSSTSLELQEHQVPQISNASAIGNWYSSPMYLSQLTLDWSTYIQFSLHTTLFKFRNPAAPIRVSWTPNFQCE